MAGEIAFDALTESNIQPIDQKLINEYLRRTRPSSTRQGYTQLDGVYVRQSTLIDTGLPKDRLTHYIDVPSQEISLEMT